MRLSILSLTLSWILAIGAAQAQGAIEHGQVTHIIRNSLTFSGQLDPISTANWSNQGPLILTISAYDKREDGFPNDTSCPASAAVVVFRSPLRRLGIQPFLAFEARQGRSERTKPFLRVQYDDGQYVTIPASALREKYLGDGWYQRILVEPFPFPDKRVRRIAVVARPDTFFGADCCVRNIQISPYGSGVPIQIDKYLPIQHSQGDELLSFVY